MGLTGPYKQHNYMGEHADDATALAFIVLVGWDSGGNPQKGMVYFDNVLNVLKKYNGTSWEIVPAHVSQHEDGGSDELNVGGLSGTLADVQPPENHAIDPGSGPHTGSLDEADITFTGTGHGHSGTTDGKIIDHGDLTGVGVADHHIKTVSVVDIPNIKSGSVASGSFGGSPLTYTVVFGTAMTSVNYAVSVIGVDSRSWTISSKTVNGFIIETNSGAALSGDVDWLAILHNDP